MHPNEKLIEKFYTGFKNSDAQAMIDCYAPDVEFSDPVFPALKGKRAMAMWAMLGERKADPMFQGMLQKKLKQRLDEFIEAHAEYK